MSIKLGDGQKALLMMFQNRNKKTESDVAECYGYASLAKGAISGMIRRGYIKKKGAGWIKGSKYEEGIKEAKS